MPRIHLPIFMITLLIAAIFPPELRAQETASAANISEPLTVGTKAPTFKSQNHLGEDFDLSDYLGKSPVVLSFWSIYCDSCVDEMLALQKLEEKYEGEGLVILAVNEDIRVSSDRILRFLERLEKFRGKITYPILFDQDSEIFTSYHGSFLPTLVLIDRDGNIASYHRSFTPERERELLAEIESLVSVEVQAQPDTPAVPDETIEFVTVTGMASLCGFYDEGRWQKSFTGNDSFEQELALTKELARRDATRQTVVESMRSLGVALYSNDPIRGCIDSLGIHLDRDPFDTQDPVSNLLELINYSNYFSDLNEQEKLIGSNYYVSRTVRISVDSLTGELTSLGYLFEPLRIEFTYVNMSPLDQREFLQALLRQSKFIGKVENPVFTSHSTSQVFEVFTSSQGFADEILGMDFADLRVFVE
ncbi:TlpA family protein disulfide reductase, partial [bacterium]